jgi:hypothetical protein
MNKDIEQLRKAYENAHRVRIKAQQHEKACIEALQGWCDHPVEALRETKWEHITWISEAEPPIRLCTHCGLTEEGPYFKTLIVPNFGQAPHISREDLFKQRLG